MYRLSQLLTLCTVGLALAACPTQREAPTPVGSDPPLPTFAVDASLRPDPATVPGVAGGPERPVGRFVGSGGIESDFVLNELVVSTDDAGALAAFLARWSGVVLLSTDLAAKGLPGPRQHLVRVEPGRADLAGLAESSRALNPSVTSGLRASSEAGLKLLAAALSESVGGLAVELNFLARASGFVSRVTADAPSAADGAWSPNAFAWPHMREGGAQDFGVTEAWRNLELAGRLADPANRVKVMIMDAGFSPNADFPAARSIHPAGALERPNTWGCSTGPGCEWHGTAVVQAAMGQVDNGFGTAGPAGPVGDLVMVQSPAADVFEIVHYLVSALPAAVAERPRVVNMSFGFVLDPLLAPVGDAFGLLTSGLRRAGILVFASADNRGQNVDEMARFLGAELPYEAAYQVPCESEGVICVGGLAWDSNRRDAGSNFGRTRPGDRGTVEVFGPFTVWVGSDPDSPGNVVRRVSGTSFSSPFVAGVAALVMAADRGLGADAVERILLETAHTGSPDPDVPRWVDANAAVTRAFGPTLVCEPPRMTISSPVDGFTATVGSSVTFSGAGVNPPGGGGVLEPGRLSWLEDGVSMGTGSSLTRSYSTPGTRRVTLRGAGCSAVPGEASITVNVVRPSVAPNTSDILSPVDNTLFLAYAGSSPNFYADVALSGRATNSDGSPVPASRLRWSYAYGGVRTEVGTGATQTARLYNPVSNSTRTYTVTLEVLDAAGAVVPSLSRTIRVRVEGAPG